jgi:hypothetical protein
VVESKASVRCIDDFPAIWASAAQTADSTDYQLAYTSLAVVDDRPAISYYDVTNRDLKFTINALADGSGAWSTYTVDAAGEVGDYPSLCVVDGRPAISYQDGTNAADRNLKFAINAAADGSGAWSTYTVDGPDSVGAYTSLAVVAGRPAIAYYDATNSGVKYAISALADGSGAWSIYTIDSASTFPSLAVVDSSRPSHTTLGGTCGSRLARRLTAPGPGTATSPTTRGGTRAGSPRWRSSREDRPSPTRKPAAAP